MRDQITSSLPTVTGKDVGGDTGLRFATNDYGIILLAAAKRGKPEQSYVSATHGLEVPDILVRGRPQARLRPIALFAATERVICSWPGVGGSYLRKTFAARLRPCVPTSRGKAYGRQRPPPARRPILGRKRNVRFKLWKGVKLPLPARPSRALRPDFDPRGDHPTANIVSNSWPWPVAVKRRISAERIGLWIMPDWAVESEQRCQFAKGHANIPSPCHLHKTNTKIPANEPAAGRVGSAEFTSASRPDVVA